MIIFIKALLHLMIFLRIIATDGDNVKNHSIKHILFLLGHLLLFPIIYKTCYIFPYIWFFLVGIIFSIGTFIHVINGQYSMRIIHRYEPTLNTIQIFLSLLTETYINNIYDLYVFRFVCFVPIFMNLLHKSCVETEMFGDHDYLNVIKYPLNTTSLCLYLSVFVYLASIVTNEIIFNIFATFCVILSLLIFVLPYRQKIYLSNNMTIIYNKFLEKFDDLNLVIPEKGQYIVYVCTERNNMSKFIYNLYNFIRTWTFSNVDDNDMYFSGSVPLSKKFKDRFVPDTKNNCLVSVDKNETVYFNKMIVGVYFCKIVDTTTKNTKYNTLIYEKSIHDNIFDTSKYIQ